MDDFVNFFIHFCLKTAGNFLFSRLLGAEQSSISKQKRMCTPSHSRASSAQDDFYTVTAVQHIDWHLHVRPWFNTCTLRCISNHYKVYSFFFLFFFFFLLSLFVTLYIFLHLTVMHSSTFGKGWVGMSACPLVVLACESLHVCTECIWRCEHARFCVEVFYALYINFHSFIHTCRHR